MSIDLEVEVSAYNNAKAQDLEIGEYGAEVAKEYADKASEYAESARESRNLAEAWAESSETPAGSETKSAKTWASVAGEWAESGAAPAGTEGAKSSKSWAEEANTHANRAADLAAEAASSALKAETSAKASKDSAEAAKASGQNADTSATSAKQSAQDAAAKLEQLEKVDLPLKANVESPVFTGSPEVPTPAAGNDSKLIANTAFVQAAIASLIAAAPGALDTLQELAGALGNDPNFAATMTNIITAKLDKTGNAVSATKAAQDGNGKNISLTYATKEEVTAGMTGLAKVASTGSYADLLDKPAIPANTSEINNDSRYLSTDADGNLTITGTFTAAKVVNAYYNDYAEFFPRGEQTESGDIIARSGDAKETYVKAAEDSVMVVGVHSSEYAQVIGGETDENGKVDIEKVLQNYIPVALAGRVHVKFYGKAEIGMKVVPSEIPGVGRGFTEKDDEGRVIGRIVKADNFQNVRLVRIMVRRQ